MRFLIIGYYGFDNFGDEALLLTISRMCTRICNSLGVKAQIKALHRNHDSPFFISRKKPFQLLRFIIRSDMIVFGGGGIFQDQTSTLSLAYYLFLLVICRILCKNILLTGIGLMPVTNPLFRIITALCLYNLPVSVRDDESARLLDEFNCPCERGSDLLFSSRLLRNRDNRDQNLPGKKVFVNVRHLPPDNNKYLVKLLRELIKNDCKITLLAFSPQDRFNLGRLLRASDIPVDDFIQLHSNPLQFSPLADRNSVMLGMRLHSLILALLYSIPFASLSSDPKLVNFCEQCGFPVFDPAQSQSVVSFVREALEEGSVWRIKAKMELKKQRQLASVNENMLKKEISSLI